MLKNLFLVVGVLVLGGSVFPIRDSAAADVIEVRRMTMELAVEIATGAVKSCRDAGYQASAVVVDRMGLVQVAMRDTLANRFTLKVAEDKANAVILSGVDSSEFRANRQDIRPEINELPDVLMMEGAVAIRAAGSLIGAVGVSGAPGGDKDEVCANDGLATVQDRLDFID